VEIIQGKKLEGVSVVIDETTFIDCMMINCILEYSGGPVAFERTSLRGCRYVFFGQAKATVYFLQGVGLLENDPHDWAEFPLMVN
jgi:hypothetical protein